ncbi:hypothetical protein JonanDRAFT_0172 [Jonquetella anthropi DSM 22815]|uniref:Uncharacterized protein n=1 Tax=Jonquetella anthropi DSM 22815 TaxID=885272 RepID=H0UMC6_9BACT|nr:hypothetical protein [Jonquetella anthropi]EHM12599.1 hypothetical protein JonanDRAFT_0172 [Jonquetella anthropi DSM 22815]
MDKEKKLKIIIAILAVLLIAVTANLAMRINAPKAENKQTQVESSQPQAGKKEPQMRVYTGSCMDGKKY